MSYRGFQSSNGAEDGNDWSRISQTLASNVHKISQNVNQIQRLINQLETSEDSQNLRIQLNEMQERTSQLTRDTNICLKELAHLPQLVQSLLSGDQNQRNPLTNSLNASNNRKTNSLVDNNNSKQFSVEKFMTPSSLVPKKSHFYEGKTVFGGANASRAARLAGTTPYNLLNRHHLAPVLRVNVETSKRLVESSQPLSSSSQRILEKLEKASTPLQDARRIPSSAHLKETSDLLHRSTKRPKLGANPVFSQTVSEQNPTFQPKRWELKLSNKDDHKVSATETKDQIINSCDNNYLIDSNETFGGKMMRKDTKREDKRTKPELPTNCGPDDSLSLLTTAKPLSMPSNLPKFSFGSKPSTKPQSTTTITKTTETQDLEFKFSEPLLKTRDQKSDAILPTGKNGRKPFVFSSPFGAITQNSSNDSEKVEKESNGLKRKSAKTGDSMSKESTLSKDNQIENKTETKKKESSLEKWICVCLFQNVSSDNKCKACKKERISQIKSHIPPVSSFKSNSTDESNVTKSSSSPITQNTSKGWGNQFKAPSGTWSCDNCFVSNPSDKEKCLACEEPKPGAKPVIAQNTSTGWGDKFKPPSGSWSCSTCFVSNPSDKDKCLSCEEPKPGAKPSVSTKESTKSSGDLWQCYYCKHNNEMSKNVCTSCAKIKTPVATKADLDKLYVGQTFKFGFSAQNKGSNKDVNEINKSNEENKDIFKQSINNSIFSKTSETTPQTTNSNAFVFGSNSTAEKNSLSTVSIPKSNDSNSGTPLFKFGAPTTVSTSTPDVNSTEKPKTNTTDIFGSNSSKNTFNFGTQPIVTTTAGAASDPIPRISSESSSPFVFGAQNKVTDLLKTKKNVSFDLEDKDNSSSVVNPNQSATDSTPLGFQISKTDEKQNLFKGFNSSPSGSIFGSVTSSTTPVTTTTTVSITSFIDNKFTSKPNETQNKISGSLFGVPATTTSFMSPFSLTNSFGSGQKSSPISGQNATESNDTKSLYSLTPSSTVKSFDSIISSQANPLISTSSATPTAPLSLSNSSSQKSLVFGNSNTNLQSFSSQSSTATTKPNFSFAIGANSGATTTTANTDNAFGGSASTLFGTQPNKGFTFGNSALNSSQTPAFSFNIPSSNSLSNTSANLNFGLNANTINTTTAETNAKSSATSLFSFGTQNSDQFSNPLNTKTLNNTNTNTKNSSQFSFGLSSNPSTGQSNSNNLFANAINPAQNISFNPLAPTAAPTANSSAFSFGGFGSNPSTSAMPQMQIRPQQSQQALPPPSFNFSAQPSFDFGSVPNAGAQTTGPVFQFSAEQTAQTAVPPNRNFKKAKRRLNPT